MRDSNDVATPYSNPFRYSVARLISIISVLLLLAASMLSIHAAITRAAPPPFITLPDSISSQVANAQPTGHYSSNASMTIGIMLYPNNQAKIDALYTQLYDPHSSLYHHWLRKKEFDSLFGPTSSQLTLITQFLSQSGLHIIQGPGPLLIPATGSTTQVEAAFHTTLNNYRLPDGTTFFANSTNIQIPMNLQGIVEGVFGLNNIVKNRPLLNVPTSPRGVKPNYGGGPNGSGLTPSQIAGIYDANPVYATMNTKGQGVTLGLMEFSHFTPGDIFAYESQYGLGTVALQYISIQGGTTDHSGALEVELDIEMMVALAPFVDHIQVYEAPNTDLGDIWGYYQIAQDDQSNAASTSWGQCETKASPSTVVSEAQSFKIMALQGQSMFAASGDNGAFACLPKYNITSFQVQDPSSQPYVTAVGGTSFAGTFDPGTNQNPSYPTGKEKAWNENCTSTTCIYPNGSGGGGGVSRFWAMPTYQTGPGVSESKYSKTGTWCKQATGISCREVPDVSLNADSASGYSVYCTDSGDNACNSQGWIMLGGTSAAAPLWAAIAGLIDSYHFAHGRTSLGFANPFLYGFNATNAYGNVFHDIPKGQGNNGHYPTGANYDMATGIGSVDIYSLALHSLYPPYQQTVYAGAGDQFMYALNASNGSLIWRHITGNMPSTPTVANGIVYFSSDEVYALNATDGSVVWRSLTGGGNYSTPVVLNNIVYVGSTDGYMYALNASTGTLIWRYQTGGSTSTPVLVQGDVYFTSGDGNLYALNATDGSLIWQTGVGRPVSAPAVYNGVIYVSYVYWVYAFNASDGSIIWSKQESYDPYTLNSPIVSNGSIYLSTHSSGNTGSLLAFNADNGAALWQYYNNQPAHFPVTIVNGMIYAGFGNNVVELNASDGTQVWSYTAGGSNVSMPTVNSNIVYIGSDDGYLNTLNASDGSLILRSPVDTNYYINSPTVAP